MTYMLDHSCLASKSQLDLFTNAPTQASVEDGFYIEHMPLTNIDDRSPLKFAVSSDGNYYIDLAKSYFYYEVKITKADGSAIGADDVVGPTNLLAHTLFKQVDFSLNDTLISDASNLYHYRAWIETWLSLSEETKKSQLSMSLYAKDTAGHMNDINDLNTGLVKRRSYTNLSATVPMIARLHTDMMFQDRYLLNGVDIKLKLIRNSDAITLMAAAASNYKLKIVNASFMCRKVKVNSGIQLKHIELLEKKLLPATYPLRRVSLKTYNIAQGSRSSNEENLYNGPLPKRIVIGLLDAESFEGAPNRNCYNFQHFDLTYACLLVDGRMIPQKPLVSSFTNGLYGRNYWSLFENTGKAFQDSGLDVDRSEYPNGYALIAWDLTPDMDEMGCYHVIKKGSIRLELKFGTALPSPVNCIVYAEHDSALKIDRNRSVLTDFY